MEITIYEYTITKKMEGNMNIAEHVTAGAALGYGAAYATNFVGQYADFEVSVVLLTGGAIFGAMLCDIDLPNSFIGHKVSLLSSLINMWVGHRTLTHSIPFMIVMALLFSMLSKTLAIGVSIGILSHIILDMFNGRGVAYLYPFVKKRIKWFTILD